MPRQPRSFRPGGFYHLTTRGNCGAPIAIDDWDRRMFVNLLARTAVRFGIHIRAWCLMTNHYHLVVEVPTGEVSRALQFLNGSYARHFNERHGRTGHVFGGRFRAALLESEEHFLSACCYVVLNPVRAGLVASAEEWRWAGSSAVGCSP
jgi:REP element-mobilizing transposase RayT